TGDQLPARFTGQAEEGQVVGFGGTAGKEHFLRIRPEECGRAFTGIFQSLARTSAGPVGAGGIAVGFAKEGPHGLPDGREDGGGGVVIEVDARHGLRRYEGNAAGDGLHSTEAFLPATPSLYRPRRLSAAHHACRRSTGVGLLACPAYGYRRSRWR